MAQTRRCFLILLILCSLVLPTRTQAKPFDFIVSDIDMTDTEAMSQETLRRFLLERGTLGKSSFVDIDGTMKPAYRIIDRIAKAYALNPKFLLVLMQREQSLVEDPNPTQKQLDWAVGYGICDSCSMDDPRLIPLRGFANQLEYAARRLRAMFDEGIGFDPGVTVVIDGQEVTPETRATAALYSYTPHLHGNTNFRDIWKRYFLMRYPDGSLLQPRGEPGVYLIQYGRKRPFTSWSALTTRYNANNIIQVPQSELTTYENGPVINFPNYSLLLTPDQKVYLLVDDTLRPIDTETFRAIGFNSDELLEIEEADLAQYVIGKPIDAQHPSISDEVLQAPNGALFSVREGIRMPILSPEIYRDHYGTRKPRRVTTAELEMMQLGEPMRFRNGDLVKSRTSATVYLITNGVRRAIASERAFRSYGFEFRDVISTSKQAIEIHPLGNPIDIIPDQTLVSMR